MAASKKRYNLGGGMSLHDARRILGVPIIAHTGRVGSYARCLGGKLKGSSGIAAARRAMADEKNITGCGGVIGGKRRKR